MKASELKSKSASELKDVLVELRKDQLNARFQQASGQLENTALSSRLRRDIARVKTVMTQKRLARELK